MKHFIGVHWCLFLVLFSAFLYSGSLSVFPTSFSFTVPIRYALSYQAEKRQLHHFEQSIVKKTSNNAASNLGRDKQLSAITSLNLCAKATLISLIMNNGGGNREACLCKFPHTVISMLNSQNSGGASENNLPPSFSSVNCLTCFYLPHITSFLLVFFCSNVIFFIPTVLLLS